MYYSSIIMLTHFIYNFAGLPSSFRRRGLEGRRRKQSFDVMSLFISLSLSICMYIYIYIQRERDTYNSLSLSLYTYIYIYIYACFKQCPHTLRATILLLVYNTSRRGLRTLQIVYMYTYIYIYIYTSLFIYTHFATRTSNGSNDYNIASRETEVFLASAMHLQSILVKGFRFYSFQLQDIDALYCYFLSLPPCVRIG